MNPRLRVRRRQTPVPEGSQGSFNLAVKQGVTRRSCVEAHTKKSSFSIHMLCVNYQKNRHISLSFKITPLKDVSCANILLKNYLPPVLLKIWFVALNLNPNQ